MVHVIRVSVRPSAVACLRVRSITLCFAFTPISSTNISVNTCNSQSVNSILINLTIEAEKKNWIKKKYFLEDFSQDERKLKILKRKLFYLSMDFQGF